MDNKKYQKKWRERNKNKIIKYRRSWRKKHPNYSRDYLRQWKTQNPNYFKDWREKQKLTNFAPSILKAERAGQVLHFTSSAPPEKTERGQSEQ